MTVEEIEGDADDDGLGIFSGNLYIRERVSASMFFPPSKYWIVVSKDCKVIYHLASLSVSSLSCGNANAGL